MVNLIRNENMKIYRRWRTWIMIAAMIGFVMTGSIVEWYYDDKEASGDAWRGQLIEQKANHEAELSEPGLSEGSKRYYEENIALAEYQLAHNIRPEYGTMWDAINGIAELVIMITLFTVIVAGDSMAGEFSTGTIKLLLIRPVSRVKILIAKYISVLIFGILLLIILFVSSVLLNGLLYQFEHLNLPLVHIDNEGTITERNMVANLWKTYLLNSVSTILFVTISFMISTVFRSSAMAIGVSIFSLFAGFIATQFVQRYTWGKYVLFANMDLTQHLTGRPFQEGMTLTFSITVLAVYYFIFVLAAWLSFTRRDVTA